MFPALHIAKEFKRIGFDRLDCKNLGKGMVYVNANQLIDLCLAFEDAAKGDTENLEYCLKVANKEIESKDATIEYLKNKLVRAGINY